MMQQPQSVELKDVILDIAQLKRKKAELERELKSLSNEIEKKENFIYDTLQNEAIAAARSARIADQAKKEPPSKND